MNWASDKFLVGNSQFEVPFAITPHFLSVFPISQNIMRNVLKFIEIDSRIAKIHISNILHTFNLTHDFKQYANKWKYNGFLVFNSVNDTKHQHFFIKFCILYLLLRWEIFFDNSSNRFDLANFGYHLKKISKLIGKNYFNQC